MGLHSGAPNARSLMDGEWRNATWAEFAKFPLENLYPLNEDLLLKTQGYTIRDLCTLTTALVPFGGLDEIGLRAGETIVVAPVGRRVPLFFPPRLFLAGSAGKDDTLRIHM